MVGVNFSSARNSVKDTDEISLLESLIRNSVFFTDAFDLTSVLVRLLPKTCLRCSRESSFYKKNRGSRARNSTNTPEVYMRVIRAKQSDRFEYGLSLI